MQAQTDTVCNTSFALPSSLGCPPRPKQMAHTMLDFPVPVKKRVWEERGRGEREGGEGGRGGREGRKKGL